jgi:hypothetical protein
MVLLWKDLEQQVVPVVLHTAYTFLSLASLVVLSRDDIALPTRFVVLSLCTIATQVREVSKLKDSGQTAYSCQAEFRRLFLKNLVVFEWRIRLISCFLAVPQAAVASYLGVILHVHPQLSLVKS